MLTVVFHIVMLNVHMPSVVMLSVVAPYFALVSMAKTESYITPHLMTIYRSRMMM